MFFYTRAIASVAAWRFAVVSPMHSLKLLLGSNRVQYKGELLHRPSGRTAFILLPCAVITEEEARGFDLSASNCKWVRCKAGYSNALTSIIVALGFGDIRKRDRPRPHLGPEQVIIAGGS